MRPNLALAAFLALGLASGSAPCVAAPGADPHGLKESPQGAIGEKLEAGANSFTEAQVKEKFAKMGFGQVTDLRKDDQGIWRGKAVHAGKALSIGMDYKGNVAAE